MNTIEYIEIFVITIISQVLLQPLSSPVFRVATPVFLWCSAWSQGRGWVLSIAVVLQVLLATWLTYG